MFGREAGGHEPRRAGERLHDTRRRRPAQLFGHPHAGSHQGLEIDAGLDAEAVQEPDKILGGQVAGGAAGVGTAAQAAGRRVDDGDAGLEGGQGVGQRLPVGVVEVDGHLPGRNAGVAERLDQVADTATGWPTPMVNVDAELDRAHGHQPIGDIDHLAERDPALQGSPKHIET